MSSMSKERIHESLVAVKATTWYSTSMDEQETEHYFLEAHEIGLWSKKTM